jgi:putative addiction module component (TIGR02574 family)
LGRGNPPERFRAETGIDGRGIDARLIFRQFRAMLPRMVTLTEIETLAFKLPQSDRAKLASDLLDSLPGVLEDDDEGVAEALRRSDEMDRDPSVCLTHDEFLKALGRKP